MRGLRGKTFTERGVCNRSNPAEQIIIAYNPQNAELSVQLSPNEKI